MADEAVVNQKMITDEAFKTTTEGLHKVLGQRDLSYAKIVEQGDALFEQILSQQQQLFAVALMKLSDNATISSKALDLSAVEISEEAIAAKVAEDVLPELMAALKVILADLVADAVAGAA